MEAKPTVAIGPEVNRPSWDWVGFDMARELSKYFNIAIFKQNSPIPKCEVAVIVKNKPHSKIWKPARARGVKIVFCPIDNYKDPSAISRHARFLGQCESVLVHCERLIPHFAPYCKAIDFVEHHNRFGLPKSSEYKENGYILWVGRSEHLDRTVQWLQSNPLRHEIRFITNGGTVWEDNLRNILPIPDPHLMFKWSPRVQWELMTGAKAAFDIKGRGFNQLNKPPTKAQKFIASGIPFACNNESYCTEYFAARGFAVQSPERTEEWFSYDYWHQTQAIAEQLRKSLSLEAVGLSYKRLIDRLLSI